MFESLCFGFGFGLSALKNYDKNWDKINRLGVCSDVVPDQTRFKQGTDSDVGHAVGHERFL